MKLVKTMTLCIICLLVGSVAVSALASDSTDLLREIMFERDEETIESSEMAILDGTLAFSIPSDWEKTAEEEMKGAQGFQYYCSDEDSLTVFFEGFVDDITIHIDREMISYNYFKEQLEKEKVDHIVAKFKGIDMILTGDDTYAFGMCMTRDAKLLVFGFETGTGKIADIAQSEKLVKDLTAIIQSIQCLSDENLARFDESFWNEDDSEDQPDAEEAATSEDAEVSFFEAVLSHYSASINKHPIPFGDQLVLTMPDDWVEIEPEDSLCAFMGTDEAGNSAVVVVEAIKTDGITLNDLEEAAKSQRCSCTITTSGRTYFMVLSDTAIVSVWLTDDNYVLRLAVYLESVQDIQSEKLLYDLHQILCGLRPAYDGELEQLAAQEALEEGEKKGEPVSFQDHEFERMVRAALKRESEEPIYAAELEAIRNLSIRTGMIKFSQEVLMAAPYQQPCVLDLSDIVLFPNLLYLNITDMECTNYEALTELHDLHTLFLNHTGLTDCGFVSGMNLTELNLYRNSLTDFSPITSLIGLRKLDLTRTGLDSLDVIHDLDLTKLSVGFNSISDLEPIAHMTHLTSLSISNTDVKSLEVLRNFKELTYLEMSGLKGEISLEPLYKLNKLQHLYYYGTSIIDVDKEKLECIIL